MAVDFKKIAGDWQRRQESGEQIGHDKVADSNLNGAPKKNYNQERKGNIPIEEYARIAKGYFVGGLMLEERDGTEQAFADSDDANRLVSEAYESGLTASEAADKIEDGWVKR